MTIDDNAAKPDAVSQTGKILSFRGRIGPAKYFLGLIAEFGILMVGIVALAGLNNPTGGGSIELAVIFPLAAIYIHLCLVTARLRDAGAAYPVPLGIVTALLPFGWVFLTIEWIEYIWPVILLGFVVLYFGPIFPKSKASEPAQS